MGALDLDALRRAVTPRTRVMLVNSPNNPTGWTLTPRRAASAHRPLPEHGHLDRRRRGLRAHPLRRGRARCAPSFLDIASADDRLVVVHSFSKSFLMTGWRLGWIVHPPALEPIFGKLIEFNTSCAPVFVQRAALAALGGAEAFVPGLIERLKSCRDILLPRLTALPGITCAVPPGGLYAFFTIEGQADSLALAKRLVAEAGLGLAPGAAFGHEGEGWLRWCFASHDPSRLERRHRPAEAIPPAIISGFARILRAIQHGAGRFHRRPQVPVRNRGS